MFLFCFILFRFVLFERSENVNIKKEPVNRCRAHDFLFEQGHKSAFDWNCIERSLVGVVPLCEKLYFVSRVYGIMQLSHSQLEFLSFQYDAFAF